MSIHALSWVLKHSPEQGGNRLVMIVLADHAQDDGRFAWPSVPTIAHEARMTRRGVQLVLRKLVASGAIVERGKTRTGTMIYDIVMGGERSAPGGEQSSSKGANSATSGGEPRSPEPSKEPSKRNQKKILTPEEEHEVFAEWLGYHCVRSERTVPKAGTSARSDLARTFAALAGEGYELEDFKLATDGVLADPFMVENGHTKPENVLRKSKIAGRIDDGRKWRAAGGESGGKYGGYG